MSTPETYAADESIRRQELLDDAFASSTRTLLNDLSVPDGAEVLDVGCGIGRTTRHLRERLPEPARVIGLDADSDLLAAAQDRSDPDSSVDLEYQEGAAEDLPFEDDRFDVVYARFLLTHLPEPDDAVEEFRRVCRPGGVVAAQEPDFASLGTWPPSRAYETIRELAGAILDPQMGRKTWGLFRAAGIEGPEGTGEPAVQAVVPVETDDTVVRELYTMSVEVTAGALLEKGELGPEEHEALVADARQVEEDPDRLTAAYTVYSVWGQV
ncbi:MAG: class I SAM-dependent methyltransferase [Salinibacter sp.]|uniref:class I SAM-dependent methyltransferase n=1 Tax=Salinibacter sp. TaxID=2065818 RepID=UPI0035D4FCBA